MLKRYDELKVNDVVKFHGANVRIVEVKHFPYNDEPYKNETKVVVRFTIEPADDEAISILGKFYSHGTYGGVGCLKIEEVQK